MAEKVNKIYTCCHYDFDISLRERGGLVVNTRNRKQVHIKKYMKTSATCILYC